MGLAFSALGGYGGPGILCPCGYGRPGAIGPCSSFCQPRAPAPNSNAKLQPLPNPNGKAPTLPKKTPARTKKPLATKGGCNSARRNKLLEPLQTAHLEPVHHAHRVLTSCRDEERLNWCCCHKLALKQRSKRKGSSPNGNLQLIVIHKRKGKEAVLMGISS